MTAVSVIIPTIGAPWLNEVLQEVHLQSKDIQESVELIVVGLDPNGVTQGKTWLTYINTNEKVYPSKARNLGFQHAQGEIICFLDDDAIPQSGWLKNLVKAQLEHGAAVTGSIDFPHDCYWTTVDTLAFFSHILADNPSGTRNHLPSLNLALHRSMLKRVGLFNERLSLGEDTELCFRLKEAHYILHLESSATVFHAVHRPTCTIVCHRAFLSGRSTVNDRLIKGLLRNNIMFNHWLGAALLAIPRSMSATYRIFNQYPALRQYQRYSLGVWLAKFSWQIGLSVGLWQTRK